MGSTNETLRDANHPQPKPEPFPEAAYEATPEYRAYAQRPNLANQQRLGTLRSWIQGQIDANQAANMAAWQSQKDAEIAAANKALAGGSLAALLAVGSVLTGGLLAPSAAASAGAAAAAGTAAVSGGSLAAGTVGLTLGEIAGYGSLAVGTYLGGKKVYDTLKQQPVDMVFEPRQSVATEVPQNYDDRNALLVAAGARSPGGAAGVSQDDFEPRGSSGTASSFTPFDSSPLGNGWEV